MHKSLIGIITQVGLLAVAAYGQLNLSNLNSNSVRAGKWTGTRMDSLSIETTVGNGIARTKLTFSVEPQGYYTNQSVSLSIPDTIWYTNTQYNSKTGTYDSIGRQYYLNYYRTVWDTIPEALDSVEISSWFTLPTDFVARNMWLWINGKPEKAYIQDKMLAEQQYNQIVGRRMDPALLTYNGNGSYMFRMFPLQSYQARKVAIEFEHTFSDSQDNISALIPVCFDTSNSYWYWNGLNTNKSGIRHVKVLLTATDSKTYSFIMPGIGTGNFSKDHNLILEADNTVKLGTGKINATNPAGTDYYAWSSVKDGVSQSEIGFSTVIAESTVVLSPEPDTRIIVLDIHQKMWSWREFYRAYYIANKYTYEDSYFAGSYYESFDMWVRAQKLAVVALKSYVDKDKKFNLIINGKELFDGPVQGTESNLSAAYTAIVAASPDESVSTVNALKKATVQAGVNAVVFISDCMAPPDGVIRTYVNSTSSGVTQTDTNEIGMRYISKLDSCKKIMEPFKGNLFVICDDNYYYYYGAALPELANSSGGYQLASLRQNYYYGYYRQVENSGKLPTLPRLYLDRGGISDVKITLTDGSSADIKYTIDGYSCWWGGRGGRMMIETDDVWYPNYYNAIRTKVRVAFKAQGKPSTVKMVITGKMGGLSFTKNVTLRPDFSGGISSEQWAFRYAEQTAQTQWNSSYDWSYWKTLQDSIKAIGYKYHIITTNTAFLALEPGMTLAVDSSSSAAQSAANEKVAAATVYTSDSFGESRVNGANLDNISLEDLIAGKISSNIKPTAPLVKSESFTINISKSQIALTIPSANRNSNLQLAIYNLSGRLIVSQAISAIQAQNGLFIWNLSAKKDKLSNGAYVMKIKAGSFVKVLKIPSLR
jgi:hypothetical protein